MSRHVFEWNRDERDVWGWIMQGMPGFDAARPGLLAHDIFEHLPGARAKHGAIADEALALGVRLALRVSTGWWKTQSFSDNGRRNRPIGVWAFEVQNLLQDIFEKDTPEPGRPRSVPVIDPAMDTILVSAARVGADHFNGEQEYEEGTGGDTAKYVDPEGPLIACITDWMRVGFKAGQDRWGSHAAGSLADAMMLQCDVELRVLGLGANHEEGEQLVVQIDESRMSVNVYKRELWEIFGEPE